MTLYTPSGETTERDRLLSLLMEWTSDPRILSAMVKAMRADFPGLATLAAMVRSTLDQGDLGETPADAQPMSERQMAAALLSFLWDDHVRRVVARYVAKAHSEAFPGKKKYRQALAEVEEVGRHLVRTHGLHPDEVPTFVTVGMVASAAMVQAQKEGVNSLPSEG